MNRIAKSTVVFVVLLVLTNHVSAQETRSRSDSEVAHRLEYIQAALNGGQAAANTWWYGWLIGYSGATAGQLAAYSSTDSEKQRQDMLVGSVTTALGAIDLIIEPMDAGRLPARLRVMPDDTPEARRAKLETAEEYLRASAAREIRGRSWKAHVISGAVNLAAGLVIWKHYNRSASDGLMTFALGQLVSEAQIFTQPMRAVRDLREYERRSDFEHAAAAGNTHPTWYVSPAPGGLLVGCTF